MRATPLVRHPHVSEELEVTLFMGRAPDALAASAMVGLLSLDAIGVRRNGLWSTRVPSSQPELTTGARNRKARIYSRVS